MIKEKKDTRKNYIIHSLYSKNLYNKITQTFGLVSIGYSLKDFGLFLISLACVYDIYKETLDIYKDLQSFVLNDLSEDIDIKNDPEYLKIKNEYKNYLSKVVQKIKFANLKDPLDIGMYFTTLLHYGEFSKTHDFIYKKQKNDKDYYYQETLGARVASGYGVCRNMAALLTDVYNKLGIKANYVRVKINGLGPFKNTNHACVLVQSDEGTFIIDPTWKSVLTLDKDNLKAINNTTFYGTVLKNDYNLLDYVDENYCYKKIDNLFLHNINESRTIERNEIHDKDEELFNLYLKARHYAYIYDTKTIDEVDTEKTIDCDLIYQKYDEEDNQNNKLSDMEQKKMLTKKG